MATCDKRHLLAILEELLTQDLKTFRWYLNQDVLVGFSPIPNYKLENADRQDTVDKMVENYSLYGAMKISLEILKKMNQNDLAERLTRNCQTGVSGTEEAGEKCSPFFHLEDAHDSSPCSSNVFEVGGLVAAPALVGGKSIEDGSDACAVYKYEYQSKLKSKLQKISEGLTKHDQKNKVYLNKIYTEVYITETRSGEVNNEHEIRQLEATCRRPDKQEESVKCNDIFESSPGRETPIRSVLTKGISGIGKTTSALKFILDWAEKRANQDIDFIFPLPFRQMNLLRHKQYNVVDLIHECIKEAKGIKVGFLNHIFTSTIVSGETTSKYKVLFVLDGLDEFQQPLNYEHCEDLCDVMKPTSVDVLLTNLITRNLLPSALLWVTSRPETANQIPSDLFDLVTEVRGFNDQQKEEYLMKRYSDENLARRIISHIKTSRSLYIMCHIPVFSWIIATVLEYINGEDSRQMPNTLTQMYTHFLVVQLKQKNIKYHGKKETESHWNEENIKMIKSLGKLAYQQLEKGNQIFYEEDLRDCGIDVKGAADCLGVCTEIFSADEGVCEEKVYCFVHLTIQELFAALHVFLLFNNDNINLMAKRPSIKRNVLTFLKCKPAVTFYKSAVDKALQSENGHHDLFLRFLLGLSLESNQTRLKGLLTQARSSSQSHEGTVKYIKKKIKENPSPERCINLFHCLSELNDHSLMEEVQHYLSSGYLSKEDLSPAQWSALAFVLITSAQSLDVFDLKQYSRSEKALLRLMPVIKASQTALLDNCNLTQQCCELLASAVSSSDLRELNLSGNNLQDAGLKLLSAGLGNPQGKLQTLRTERSQQGICPGVQNKTLHAFKESSFLLDT